LKSGDRSHPEISRSDSRALTAFSCTAASLGFSHVSLSSRALPQSHVGCRCRQHMSEQSQTTVPLSLLIIPFFFASTFASGQKSMHATFCCTLLTCWCIVPFLCPWLYFSSTISACRGDIELLHCAK
jgi:hypothetical protein